MYWSLIAWEVDSTPATDDGAAVEWGMYVESSVCDGSHVLSHCI